MLRRLLLVLIPLLLLLAAALGVPLATAVAERETQTTYLDRLADVSRFASLAQSALVESPTAPGGREALRDELNRYGQLYGIPVAVVAAGGDDVVLASPQRPNLTDPAVAAGLSAAFAGYRPSPPSSVLPWETAPLVVVEPVGRDSEVVAAVVAVSPTDRLRADILSQWGWLAVLGSLPLLAVIAAAWPISRWILRPVRRLDEAAAAIAGGLVDTHVDVGGPPELRRLSTSFNTMVDVVNTALRRQRDFVADASHQLRNPLASLRLAVDNLEPHLPPAELAQEAHQIAVEEAQEMGNVLDALLAATRLDAAAETVDLALLVSTHLPKWQALRVAVETDVPAGQRVPVSYGSVLDELVANAARLSGGTKVRVFFADGELHVADNGMGLDEEDRKQALNRFWRSPQHQNITGTGLGLAICADLVAAAGGELRLEDADPGLDVVISL